MNVPIVRGGRHPVEQESIAKLCQGLRLAPGIETVSRRAVAGLRALKEKIVSDVRDVVKFEVAFDAEVLLKAVDPTPGLCERLTLSIGLKMREGNKPLKLEGDLAWALGLHRINEHVTEDDALVRVARFNKLVITDIKELEEGFTVGLTIEVEHNSLMANPQVS
jgi:hypothetical protein